MIGRCLGVFVLFALSGAVNAHDKLPDGGVATASGSGPVQAWYGQPTTRYDHGILGDAIEGGALVAIDATGKKYVLTLPERYVFEDLTPRLADLDGDGANEIVTIRTDVTAGAAVAVYELADGQLRERAATRPIGKPHRWLSIAAIANFTADPGNEIAIVKTPHIGGVLEILSLKGDTLETIGPPVPGFSTHFIGSRDLSLARAEDVNADNFAELALPTQDRRDIKILSFVPALHVIDTIAAGQPLTRPIGSLIGLMNAPR